MFNLKGVIKPAGLTQPQFAISTKPQGAEKASSHDPPRKELISGERYTEQKFPGHMDITQFREMANNATWEYELPLYFSRVAWHTPNFNHSAK